MTLNFSQNWSVEFEKTFCYGLRYRPRMTQTAGHPFPDERRGVLQSYACYIPYTGLIDSMVSVVAIAKP